MISTERTELVNACRTAVEEAIESTMHRVFQFVTDESESSEPDFSGFLLELERAVGGLFETMANAALQSLEPISDVVEVNGTEYRRMDGTRKRRVFIDLRGSVGASGSLFRQVGVRNGPTIRPLELRAGIVDGRCTPRAAEVVARYFQAVPRDEAMELLGCARALPALTGSSLYRIALALGEQWTAFREDAESVRIETFDLSEAAVAVSVAVDRVTVPMAEARALTSAERTGLRPAPDKPIQVVGRQAYVGCLTIHDAQKRPLHTFRYARMPTEGGLQVLEEALRADLLTVLERRPELKVATLADGAAEMQTSLDRITEGVDVDYRGIDVWHAVGYLNAACTALQEPQSVASEYRHRLMEEEDGGLAILNDLLIHAYNIEHDAARPTIYLASQRGQPTTHRDRHVHEKHRLTVQRLQNDVRAVDDDTLTVRSEVPRFSEHVPEELVCAIRYFWNHWERMDFARATDLGLPIGSGHVEASCKTIVTVRMKRTGARWRPTGAQTALDFRSLAVSDEWDAAMQVLLDTYKERVDEVRAA